MNEPKLPFTREGCLVCLAVFACEIAAFVIAIILLWD